MNFTREPIIETIITPRDGYRLLLRSSKAADREDHSVEAVEVVSFGHSFFYRSLERAKPFLLPLSDYELLEHREVRMSLHNTAPDRAIKINGGRQSRESEPVDEEPVVSQSGDSSQGRREGNKRRSRRRRSGRGGEQRPGLPQGVEELSSSQEDSFESSEVAPVVPLIAPPPMSRLIPPPATLIKETIGRYKTSDEFSPPPVTSRHGSESAQESSVDFEDDLL